MTPIEVLEGILMDLTMFLMEERDIHIEMLYYLTKNLYEMNFLYITPFYYFMIIAFFISSYVWIKAINDKPSSIPLFVATGFIRSI